MRHSQLKETKPMAKSGLFSYISLSWVWVGLGERLRGYQEVKGEGGEGLKGIAELECQKRLGL